MEIFVANKLPDIDQQQIKRGMCPWCLLPLYDGALTGKNTGDICAECGDEFIGELTIND